MQAKTAVRQRVSEASLDPFPVPAEWVIRAIRGRVP